MTDAIETNEPKNPRQRTFKDLIGHTEEHLNTIATRDYKFETDEEKDAFRHIAGAAIATQKYGPGWTYAGGYAVEVAGSGAYLWGVAKDYITGEEKSDTAWQWYEETTKDMFNNPIGVEIGQVAKSEKEIFDKAAERIRNGEAVVKPTLIRDFFDDVGDFFSSQSPVSTSNFLPSSSSGEFTMDDYQKQFMELPLFTTIVTLLGQSIQKALANERIQSSTAESERSRQTQANWRLSRSQQEIMLAQMVSRGSKDI